jgi:hypothetical protein
MSQSEHTCTQQFGGEKPTTCTNPTTVKLKITGMDGVPGGKGWYCGQCYDRLASYTTRQAFMGYACEVLERVA